MPDKNSCSCSIQQKIYHATEYKCKYFFPKTVIKRKIPSRVKGLWHRTPRLQVLALRVGLCKITILGGGDLPTLGLPHMTCHSR